MIDLSGLLEVFIGHIKTIAEYIKANSYWTLPVLFSGYLVWLSHLRGADIKVINKPEIRLRDEDARFSEEKALDYGINEIPLEDIELVLVNVGNRSGIIKDMWVKFDKNEKFIFFRNFSYNPEINESIRIGGEIRKWHEEIDFFVKDRTSELIRFGFPYFELNSIIAKNLIEFNWEGFNLKKSSLSEVIDEILEVKRKNLQKFVELLESTEQLGEFTLRYSHLKSRLIRIPRVRKGEYLKDEGPIEIPYKIDHRKLFLYYKSILERWDDIEFSKRDIIEGIKNTFKTALTYMNENRGKLLDEDSTKLTALKDISIVQNWSICSNLVRRWGEHKIFIEELEEISAKIRNLKDKGKTFSLLSSGSEESKKLNEELKEEKSTLDDEVSSLIDKIPTIIEELDSEMNTLLT